jgi:hypothetical protein
MIHRICRSKRRKRGYGQRYEEVRTELWVRLIATPSSEIFPSLVRGGQGNVRAIQARGFPYYSARFMIQFG